MAKILIVDDEPINCLILEKFLTEAGKGHDAKSCESGAEAIQLAASWNPDLIFMDLNMPGMDGITAITNIRKQGYTGKIIIVTANHSSQNARLGAKAGANGFLAKPVDGKNITSVVESILPS
ncbi:MAG: response regulator [Magnetococcales bacterium]|nr:response regulator [Magnetococcales bacterium]MBF0414687.1 response regulator [Magnetococcales bacterium]MBF0419084.1 response regulator [Magnetococcales bacterium]